MVGNHVTEGSRGELLLECSTELSYHYLSRGTSICNADYCMCHYCFWLIYTVYALLHSASLSHCQEKPCGECRSHYVCLFVFFGGGGGF